MVSQNFWNYVDHVWLQENISFCHHWLLLGCFPRNNVITLPTASLSPGTNPITNQQRRELVENNFHLLCIPRLSQKSNSTSTSWNAKHSNLKDSDEMVNKRQINNQQERCRKKRRSSLFLSFHNGSQWNSFGYLVFYERRYDCLMCARQTISAERIRKYFETSTTTYIESKHF